MEKCAGFNSYSSPIPNTVHKEIGALKKVFRRVPKTAPESVLKKVTK